jgi:hypothetical protein
MEHVSHKDKQKEEVCPEKRRDQHELLGVSQPILGGNASFPSYA